MGQRNVHAAAAVKSSQHRALTITGSAIQAPLIGREVELALLVDRWKKAEQGGGQGMLVCAEPGVGKTRLIAELKSHVQQASGRLIELQCSPYDAGTSFHPVVDAMQRTVASRRARSAATGIDELVSWFDELGVDLESIVPLIAPLLSLPLPDVFTAPTITSDELRRRTLNSLTAIVDAHTAQGSLLASGLARRHRTSAGGDYEFKHALIRDTAYESLLKRWRQVLHGQLLEYFAREAATPAEAPLELLAHHACAAHAWRKSFDYARQAGSRAALRGANAAALTLFDIAFKSATHLPPGDELTREMVSMRIEFRSPLHALGHNERLLIELTTALEAGGYAVSIKLVRVANSRAGNCKILESVHHERKHGEAARALFFSPLRIQLLLLSPLSFQVGIGFCRG